MQLIQDLVHKLEVGGGMRYLRIGLAVLVVFGVVVLYNMFGYKNFYTREAMDAAQLGRNISQGKGFSTDFIRPLSMRLVAQHHQVQPGALSAVGPGDPYQLKGGHPDVSNPPVYPVVLAGLFKVMPFDYSIPLDKPFWSEGGRFLRYRPDFWVALFNQALFAIVIVLVFFLARRLFEPRVAWLSGALLLGTDLLWRFSFSGLSTMLLMVICVGLVWSLVLIEHQGREPNIAKGRLMVLAVVAGLFTGMGGLTRYSFGWLILPVLMFLLFFGGSLRIGLTLAALLTFLGVMTPWVARNYVVSGTPFGTAGYALWEGLGADSLMRSLNADDSSFNLKFFTLKLLVFVRQTVLTELPRLAGSWPSAFFFVGLFISFPDPATRRLRYFLISALLMLALVQALGHTAISDESPEINTENLLVILLPFALVYSVSFFFLVLDQMELPLRELRYVVIGIFCLLVYLPTIFLFLPPRGSPLSPIYQPAALQGLNRWVKEGELVMSDVPWAVAWYAQRPCIWATSNGPADFGDINDYHKPIQAMYMIRPLPGWHLFWQQVSQVLGSQRISNTAPKPIPVGVNLPYLESDGRQSVFPLHYWQVRDLAPGTAEILVTARERSTGP